MRMGQLLPVELRKLEKRTASRSLARKERERAGQRRQRWHGRRARGGGRLISTATWSTSWVEG